MWPSDGALISLVCGSRLKIPTLSTFLVQVSWVQFPCHVPQFQCHLNSIVFQVREGVRIHTTLKCTLQGISGNGIENHLVLWDRTPMYDTVMYVSCRGVGPPHIGKAAQVTGRVDTLYLSICAMHSAVHFILYSRCIHCHLSGTLHFCSKFHTV